MAAPSGGEAERERQRSRSQPGVFAYSEADFHRSGVRWGGPGPGSRLDRALRSAWEERRDCFRYSLPQARPPSRVLPGPSRLLAQLNPQRATERRRPQPILGLRQPFDPRGFHFGRIGAREILFALRPGQEEEALLVINVSPLEFGHVLLLPEPARGLPQVLSRASVLRGLELMFLSSDPGFRVGFNSLGALASVNHLHLHGYYLPHRLRVEWAATEPLTPDRGGGRAGHPVHLMSGHPTRGLVLYTDGTDIPQTAAALHRLADFLLDRSLAHNLFLTRGCPLGGRQEDTGSRDGVRLILWPRRSVFGVKEPAAFNVALCELAGHLPVNNPEDYSSLTEEKALEIIRKYLLPEEELSQLRLEIAEFLED
uniref:GDP-D-glucose phosphorylase 1 n=1 Tax=Pristiophorus japonicus TaxID=55135 RepID=UPI00398F2AF2